MDERVLLEIAEGVATITLNDPARRNAQSREMGQAFAGAIERVKGDPAVRVAVITGAGQAFCAGGDLEMLAQMLNQEAETNRRAMAEFYRYFLCITELEIPTIAAINGAAIGAGLSFALGCDMRIAADDAKLGFTYLNIGLHPGMGTHFLLPRLVGVARAFELISTGKLIDGREAERIGLVNAAVPLGELKSTVDRLAKTLTAQPAGALKTAKHVMYMGLREGLSNSLELDAMAQTLSFASPEMRERVNALRAKLAGTQP